MTRSTKPERIRIAGEWYRATLCQITTSTGGGRPLTLRVLRDDETVELQGGERFLIVYVHGDGRFVGWGTMQITGCGPAKGGGDA